MYSHAKVFDAHEGKDIDVGNNVQEVLARDPARYFPSQEAYEQKQAAKAAAEKAAADKAAAEKAAAEKADAERRAAASRTASSKGDD